MSEKQKFYITTPIYYPSDNLHIGHSYCSTAADTMARFNCSMDFDPATGFAAVDRLE